MFLLTIRDMQHRAMRFGLVIVGTTVVFTLLLLMNGISEHFAREPEHTVRAIGADAWLLPAGVSGPFTSATTLDPALAASVSGVDRADPIVVGRGTIWRDGEPQEIIVVGHALGGVGTPPVTEGAAVRGRGQLLADDTLGLRPGDRIRVGSSEFDVAGLTENTTVLAGLPLVFMSIEDSRVSLFRGAPVATAILTRGRPSEVPAGLEILSPATVAEDARRPLERATSSIDLITFLLWIVSGMIIGGVVYLSSMERRRDFAVMKAVGGSTRGILAGLAGQSLVIAIVAAALASGLQLILVPRFPLTVEVSSGALIQLPVIACVVALLASIAGMRRVARTDPALAFSGPGV